MISPESLRRFSLFGGIDPAFFKDLAMLGENLSFSEGDWLFAEGAEAAGLYLLERGTVELKINLNEEGTEHADLSTLVEGNVIGWSALVEPYQYTLGAVATSDVSVIKLDALALRRMMASNPEMGYTIMTHLANALGERLTNLRVQFVSLTLA